MREVRCPNCGSRLFDAEGHGTLVRIVCRNRDCKHMVEMSPAGNVLIVQASRTAASHVRPT